MKKECTPSVTMPGQTVYRFTESEVIEALTEWLKAHPGDAMPDGECEILHSYSRNDVVVTLVVTTPAPEKGKVDHA